MGLAVIAEQVGLYSSLYALADGQSKLKYEHYFQKIEQVILNCNEGYTFRIGDFVKTYEYILTTENIDTITLCAKILANILRYDGFEREYQKYRNTAINEIDALSITKLFIVDFEEEKSWRLLSKYSNDCGKYGLNYSANLLWLLKFNEKGHPLTNCMRALDQWVDDNLPKNYLMNNLYLLCSNLRINGYWQSFNEHITKNSSFSEASDTIINAYMSALTSKQCISDYECSLLILILSQIRNASRYYAKLLEDDDSAFVRSLLSNMNCLVRFLALGACEREDILNYSEKMDSLRNHISTERLSEKEWSAIRWVNTLFDLRNEGKYDETFFDASRVILANYPSEPAYSIVSEKILVKGADAPINYSLVTYWINTFDNLRIVSSAHNYMLRKKRSDDKAERIKAYRLQATILRKLIIYYDGKENRQIPDYLRVCKSYLAIKILSHDRTVESDAFRQKMYSGLRNKREINTLNAYETALADFSSNVRSPFIKEEVLYCGITNYWDVFLWTMLNRTDELQESVDAIISYMCVLDRRPLHRRLLQMYLYVSVANLHVLGTGSKKIDTIRVKEVFTYRTDIETGTLSPEQYFASLQSITNLLCPAIGDLIYKISNTSDSVKMSDYLYVMFFVLANKKWNEFAAKLVLENIKDVDKVLIPCVAIIQNPKEIGQIVEYLAYNRSDIVCNFLNSREIKEIIGTFFINYYYAIYETKCGRYETAQQYLDVAGEGPHYMMPYLEKLSNAISNREDIDGSKIVQQEIKREELPQLSFVSSKDPEGVALSQLMIEFYSESGLHDAATKCLIAQRIYFYLAEGSTIRDVLNFVYRWGFYAAECEYDIERKANILFELLDNIHMLKDELSFKEHFVQQFIYILNEYEFHIFTKDFSKIMEHYTRLYAEFQPFDDCLCYAELMVHLSRLTTLATNNMDASKIITQIEEIQKNVLAVSAKYPHNYFARKCIEFVDQFKYQLFERGVFEVRILNEQNLYDGIVYYQIKNVGFETIPEISLTLYLDGIGGTIRRVKISDELPGGLRPNQVYAGEYAANVDVPKGKEIVCILQLEYGDKNYIVIDGSSGGTLVSGGEEYQYHKSSFSGYLESTIDSDDQKNFIGRHSEIEEIEGSIVKRQNVLLFGTNGTGKSSILNYLSSASIPELCEKMGKQAVAINIVSDDGDTELQVVNGLLDRICSENCVLLREIRKIERRNPNMDLADTYDYLNDAIARRSQLVIVDENGVNSSNIIELFISVSLALKCGGLKLFLLWDNFEKVISSPNINPKHMRFLRTLRETPNAMSNVLFIFSGSNYLLEAVSIKQGSDSWNEILTRCATRIKIGNLCYEDFHALMSQERALNNGEIHYTPEAIEYLWKYTNGHAFYSCLLGNRTLEILSSRRVRRRCIYPSDIFMAIYKSDKLVHTEGSDTSKETAIEKQIFQDISNNIAVKYVGRKLAEYIAQGSTKMSHVKLQDVVLRTRPDINESSFNAAIDILRARDFIRKIDASSAEQAENSSGNWFEYLFTSDLYLERFVHIYVPELTRKATEDIERRKKDIYDMLRDATTEDIERLKKLMGTSTSISGGSVTTTTFEKGATQTNNTISVNIQSITNTLNGILAAGSDATQILSGLQNLPRLNAYLGDGMTSLLEELESDDLQVATEAEAKLDSSTTRMVSDYLAALVSHDDNPESFCVWKQLGISKPKYDALSKKIVPTLLAELILAVKLDYIFSLAECGQDGSSLIQDYSPVSIMYCKILEKMLKFYHTDIYVTRFPRASTEVKEGNNKVKVKFGELGSMQRQRKLQIQNKILLGAFLYPINPDYIAESQWIEIANDDDDQAVMWETHGRMLSRAKEIRNVSAHGADGIVVDKDMLSELKHFLFEGEGLKTIVDLR